MSTLDVTASRMALEGKSATSVSSFSFHGEEIQGMPHMTTFVLPMHTKVWLSYRLNCTSSSVLDFTSFLCP